MKLKVLSERIWTDEHALLSTAEKQEKRNKKTAGKRNIQLQEEEQKCSFIKRGVILWDQFMI